MSEQLHIETSHDNCEHCNNFIEGSVEQFLSTNQYNLSLGYGKLKSASGYGGTTADGIEHNAMVSWAQ